MKPGREATDGAAPNRTLLARLGRLQKRHLALALLVPVLVVLWLPLITGKKKSPNAPAAAGDPAAAPAGEPARPTNPIDAALALDERLERLVLPYEPRWSARRDPAPFRAPVVFAAETVANADAALVPSSIVLSAGQAPFAIIAGHIYRPGDTIDGRSILAIEERRVLFREGNKTYAVSLPAPTLRGPHD